MVASRVPQFIQFQAFSNRIASACSFAGTVFVGVYDFDGNCHEVGTAVGTAGGCRGRYRFSLGSNLIKIENVKFSFVLTFVAVVLKWQCTQEDSKFEMSVHPGRHRRPFFYRCGFLLAQRFYWRGKPTGDFMSTKNGSLHRWPMVALRFFFCPSAP